MEESKTLKLRCFITGEETIFSGDYLKKLIEKYGTKENLVKYYICYKAKSLLFKGYSLPEIRKILVLKKIKLEDANSEASLELVKYWQDQKTRGMKFKLKESEKNVSFTKTDEDVKNFIDKWNSSKILDESLKN